MHTFDGVHDFNDLHLRHLTRLTDSAMHHNARRIARAALQVPMRE
jgi:hypothetical protein